MALEKTLKTKYTVALSLIAVLLTLSFLLITKEISQQENSGYVINISGMQRMALQRIGLISSILPNLQHELESEVRSFGPKPPYMPMGKEAARKLYQEKLEKLDYYLRLMARNHEQLVTGDLQGKGSYELSEEIERYFFDEQGANLDKRVRDYIAMGQSLLVAARKADVSYQTLVPIVAEITKTARSEILNDLNRVVIQYEQESYDATRWFQRLELFAYLLALIVLVIEARFIFSPMVKDIAQKTAALDDQNKELQRFSFRLMHDIRPLVSSVMGQMELVNKYASSFGNQAVSTLIGKTSCDLADLKTLLDRMLEIVKMKAISAPKEPIRMTAFLGQQADAYRKRQDGQKVDIQVECSIEQPVSLQKPYLNLAIENLLQHTISYASSDCETSIVAMSAKTSDRSLRITCQYIGGETSEHSEEDIVVKAKMKAVQPMNDLSLYLATEAVQMMGGKLEHDLKKKAEKSPIFTLTVPLQAT